MQSLSQYSLDYDDASPSLVIDRTNQDEEEEDEDESKRTDGWYKQQQRKPNFVMGRKRRGNLPKSVTAILKHWLIDHHMHPYPTEEEKRALRIQTNLTLNQISNWFINARRRLLPLILVKIQNENGTTIPPLAPRKRSTRRRASADQPDGKFKQILDAFVTWYNELHPSSSILASDLSHSQPSCFGSREEAAKKLRQFYESDQFKRVDPFYDFALEALTQLKQRHFRLVLITDRDQFIAEPIQKFAQRHFAGLFEAVHLCSLVLTDGDSVEAEAEQKLFICREIRADVLITDSCLNALECASAGTDVILYDCLCSCQSRCMELSPNVKRMPGWRHLAAQFPKPKSPLRFCHYPDDFLEEDEEDIEVSLQDNEHQLDYYETIEIEEWSDEEAFDTEQNGDEDDSSSEDTEGGSQPVASIYLDSNQCYDKIMLDGVVR
ncbi:Homeobox protein pknox1 [Apophysomyces sp. BC1034]|nr:Homeobox protein pknox1 [Apophysomyces sp. BC1034]